MKRFVRRKLAGESPLTATSSDRVSGISGRNAVSCENDVSVVGSRK